MKPQIRFNSELVHFPTYLGPHAIFYWILLLGMNVPFSIRAWKSHIVKINAFTELPYRAANSLTVTDVFPVDTGLQYHSRIYARQATIILAHCSPLSADLGTKTLRENPVSISKRYQAGFILTTFTFGDCIILVSNKDLIENCIPSF